MMLTLKIVAFAAILAVLVHFATQAVQQRLLYFPELRRISPAEAGLDAVEERSIAARDGTAILTWWGEAAPGQPTVLYFHGNAGSFANRAERIRKYMARGYGVVMMTYRGYGGSSGRPSEKANVEDAKTVYEALRASGIPADEIVLYGESLGSGVAVQVATEKAVAGIILDAPYTSIADLANLHYPHLPARWLMTDRYETLSYAPRVTVPVLIVHGEADSLIPVEMGRKVGAALKGPVKVATFPLAGHSDHYLHGSYDVIFEWLTALANEIPRRRAG